WAVPGLLLAASSLVPALAAAQEARPFRPEECFPADTVIFVQVRNVESLRQKLGSTLFGRMATHPGIRAALGKLPDLLRGQLEVGTAEFSEATGMSLLSALELIRGEVAVGLRPPSEEGTPSILCAIELGPRRSEILGLLE